MNDLKYVAFDIHKSTIVIAVLNFEGKFISQAIIKTQARPLVISLAI